MAMDQRRDCRRGGLVRRRLGRGRWLVGRDNFVSCQFHHLSNLAFGFVSVAK
jgi:hypothetical protein